MYNKMAAGGPAGNTRMTFAGTCNARPVASLTVAVRADEGAIRAAEPAAMNVRRYVVGRVEPARDGQSNAALCKDFAN